jgi:hypothetical protein
MEHLMPSGWPIEIGTACLPSECIEGSLLEEMDTVPLYDNLNALTANQFFEWVRD